MPRRKKPAPPIEQSIRLTPQIVVTIVAPESDWPRVKWDGAYLSIDARPEAARIHIPVGEEPVSNTPTHDTPEIIEMKRKLEEREAARRPVVKTSDAFAKAGIDLDPGELELALVGGGIGG